MKVKYEFDFIIVLFSSNQWLCLNAVSTQI